MERDIQLGITVVLTKERATPGTVVYTEKGVPRADQTFPTIYVQKSALTDPPPEMLEVTIRAK